MSYWLRSANIERLREAWQRIEDPSVLLVPRGAVFHIPPSNVDTLFVYSWMLSALAGNGNVLRASSKATRATTILLAVVEATLLQHPRVAASTAVVAYVHDDAVTAALSAADVRVIWGGDETVRRIRSVPLPPRSIELTFPDRFSMALLDAATVLRISEDDTFALAAKFFNDSYWFDQLACSSPRLIFWRGSAAEVTAARLRFCHALTRDLVRRSHGVGVGVGLAKFVHTSSEAANGLVGRVVRHGNELTVAELHDHSEVPRGGPGGGLFYDLRVDDLHELCDLLEGRDQTISHFGFSAEELRALTRQLNGRAIDRMVPVGQALDFDRFWDGHDLLLAFSKRVVIRTETDAASS